MCHIIGSNKNTRVTALFGILAHAWCVQCSSFLLRDPWFIAALSCVGIMAKGTQTLKTEAQNQSKVTDPKAKVSADPKLKKPKVDFTPADALKAAGYKFAAMKAAAMNTKGKVKKTTKAKAKGKPKAMNNNAVAKAAAAAKKKGHEDTSSFLGCMGRADGC